MSQNGEIMITITNEAISKILQAKITKNSKPLLVDFLIDLYKKLTFPQREKIFEIYLPEDAQLPKTNPPYSYSMFPEVSKQIINIISYLLGYHSDQWVDEAIVGFLSIFINGEKPVVFNYNEFIAEEMHEKFLKFPTEGAFKYDVVLVYMFIYHQEDMFPFTLHKMDE